MFLQLNPPLPLTTPKGKAWAIALIDYGPQWDLQWVTFLHDSGECWTFLNKDIRQEDNYTFGIPHPSAIHRPGGNGKDTPAMRPALNSQHNGNGHSKDHH